jgi:triacylglycerol lipase
MGVTIGRKAIKGGNATDHVDGNYNLGPSLKGKVKSFIGLAGANLGLNQCYSTSVLPTCNSNDGFYPGLLSFSGPSKFLADLNTNGGA